jgi:hypothetical protein
MTNDRHLRICFDGRTVGLPAQPDLFVFPPPGATVEDEDTHHGAISTTKGRVAASLGLTRGRNATLENE